MTIIILRESLRHIQLIGLVLGLFGLSLIVSNSIFMGNYNLLSICFALLSLMGMTIGTILQKKYCSHQPLTTNLFYQYMASMIFVLILYVLLDYQSIHWTNQFIMSLSWMVLVISIGATYLYYALLMKNKAVTVTSYLYCIPPITAILDYIIYRHTLSSIAILGMLLVVMSLILINKKKISNERVLTAPRAN